MKKKNKKKVKKKVPAHIKVSVDSDAKYDLAMEKFMKKMHPKCAEDTNALVNVLSNAIVFTLSRFFVKYDKDETERYLNSLHIGIKKEFAAKKKAMKK